MKRQIVELVVLLILFALAMLWVSKIPEGTPGLFGKQPEEVYSIEYAETPIIEEIPMHLFDDPPLSIEVNYATPTSAIEEPKKGLALIEKLKQEPKMTYLGEYELTAYAETGSPCSNGNYPTCNYTVACNSLPLGTKIHIVGYGDYVVEDRGGMPNSVIDVYMGDYWTCIQFGRRTASVYIYE
jgi:3D (Asp-Asp-Asp) domain-containing protein